MVHLRKAQIRLNATSLFDRTGWSTIPIGSANNSYSAYPIALCQFFGTLSVAF